MTCVIHVGADVRNCDSPCAAPDGDGAADIAACISAADCSGPLDSTSKLRVASSAWRTPRVAGACDNGPRD